MLHLIRRWHSVACNTLLLALTFGLIAGNPLTGNSGAFGQEQPPATTQPATETPVTAEKPANEQEAPSPSDKPAEEKPTEDKPKETKPTEKASARKLAEEKKKEEEAKHQVQVLPLSGDYVDFMSGASLDPTSLLLGNGSAKQKSFYRLCEYLEELGKNEKIDTIVFDLSDSALGFNLAQLDELTRRLAKLKSTGKRLIAWLENASATHLSVAACCNQVFLTDFGGIDFPSTSMQSMHYREAMDLVGVKASVVRAGNFKGAVEPYTNAVMSDHLRDHYLEMLKTMNEAQVSLIAKGRGLTSDAVRTVQKQRMLLPAEALQAGLVDHLVPYGSMEESINKFIAEPAHWTTYTAKPKQDVSIFELMGKIMSGPADSTTKTKNDSIAVLHLSGAIEDGKKSSGGSIVSGPTVKAIEELISDDKIKGVVVRINSPGGSATASEAIRQALVKLVAKKPTIVSMGDVAASGGYWVSCIGVPVYAERGTLTGSIGVFTMKLSFGSLLRRVGVHVENIVLDDSASAFAPDRTWSEVDEAVMQKSIDDVYARFLKLVSGSRGISVEKLQDLAGGRVWSGAQAKQHGLVDEIGGLDDCLAIVAKKANLEKYDLLHRPTGSAGLGLLDLIGEPDADEIQIAGISLDALRLLQKRGFSVDSLTLILRDAMANSGSKPTVWALTPAEVRIR